MKTEKEIQDKHDLLLMKRNTCQTHGSKVQYDRILDTLEWVIGKRENLDGSSCGDPKPWENRS